MNVNVKTKVFKNGNKTTSKKRGRENKSIEYQISLVFFDNIIGKLFPKNSIGSTLLAPVRPIVHKKLPPPKGLT